MRPLRIIAALILATAPPALAQNYQNYELCEHEAQRTADIDATGIRLLQVRAGAGLLKIQGRAGLTRIVIRGRACASDRRILDRIELRANRSGSEVQVEAMQREEGWVFTNNSYGRLDVVMEVPAHMSVVITDGSGSIELANLGAVNLTDGSGEITASDLHGDVRIHDGSGNIKLTDMSGKVDIRDGSGAIELRNIGGVIDVTDGSGEVQIRAARNSIRVSDGSGNIDVDGVAGDLTVERDGSGTIDYANVRGRVDIPRRRR